MLRNYYNQGMLGSEVPQQAKYLIRRYIESRYTSTGEGTPGRACPRPYTHTGAYTRVGKLEAASCYICARASWNPYTRARASW